MAEALAEKHPHAATTLNSRTIDNVLERAASKSYVYAARSLSACDDLVDRIDWSANKLKPHDRYLAELHRRHSRKSGFWALALQELG